MSKEIVKPLLKWVGGKTQILSNISSKLPTGKDIEYYHEPFVGGGSMLLMMLSLYPVLKEPDRTFAYDMNKYLINFYKVLSKQPNELVKELDILINTYNNKNDISSKEKYYYDLRTLFNTIDFDNNKVLFAAFFLFLNKTCFRGLYRTGPNGFNVPFGNYKNVNVYNKEHLLNVSNMIKNVTFEVCDFKNTIQNILDDSNKNIFVYLDPPYVQESSISFVKYNKDGFSDKNHNKLFELCHQLDEKNILFMLSNSNTTKVRDALNKFHISVIECRRAINSKDPSSKTTEVLVSNYQ
jgi:DNA adenine methylase